jgi:hypothetical protein
MLLSRGLAACVGGVTLLTFALALGATAQTVVPPFSATTLNISAAGEVKVPPDSATLTVGVETDAASAGAAARANAERMSELMATIRNMGIAERDVQTARLSLNPQYVYEANQPPRLTGYQASNQITVTLVELANLPRLVDAVAARGATNVGEISFTLANPVAAENSARLVAIKALQDKAALYAQATGLRVNRLVNLAEGVELQSTAPMTMAAKRAPAQTPISPGRIVVRVEVSGLFELSR